MLNSMKKRSIIIGVLVLIAIWLLGSWFYGPKIADEINRSGSVTAGGSITETFAADPARSQRLTLTTSRSGGQITLRQEPAGQNLVPSAESSALVKIYDLPLGGSGSWQISISNPSPTTPLDYTLETKPRPPAPGDDGDGSDESDDDPPVTIDPIITPGEDEDDVSISITIKETVVSIVSAITGAQVTANIVCPPDPTVITIILQEEDPIGQPGVYTGKFSHPEGGTCQIEYVIDGENSEGDPFVETITDEFVIPPGKDRKKTYNKKYDISWGDQVQIIGY